MLQVTTPQGAAGELHHDTQYVFNYTTRDREAEIALGMPLRAQSYAAQVLPPIFEMNRPEGFLLQRLHELLLKHGGVDDMRLLAAVGRNTIGRVMLSDPRQPPVAAPAMSLEALRKASPSGPLFEHLLNTYVASGVSGVQPKVLVPDRITLPQPNLIVKAQGTLEFLTQNEFVCMEAARRAEIEVPRFWLSDDGGLFILERFDRAADEQPLGFEDMAVVMGKRTHEKYQGSYENLAKAIAIYAGPNASESLRRLFDYVTLSVMVGNGDAHLKNFGLTYAHPSATDTVRLAPLYDVVTTTAYAAIPGTDVTDQSLALKLGRDRRFPNREALLRFGREVCHVLRPEPVLERIAEGMRSSWKEHAGLFPAAFAAKLNAQWEQGLALAVRPR
jgi:serine/threonine-protein kinase HipA